MAGIWKTQHTYEGYINNMLKKKCLQPVYPSSNDKWSRYRDINNNQMENKLSAAQHNMERNMLNITYKDRKTNKSVRDQTKLMDIMEII